MMFASGPVFMLLMLISSGGGSAHDLVSVVDAADYFQAHNIDVKADALVELAGKDPEDAKAQVAQLLALRWLGEHAEQARKVKTARTTIQQIADGKQAQDPLGFAKDYAQATLALLDGKPALKPAAIPANSVAREGLRWFPDSAGIFGAFDMRASGEVAPLDESRLRSFLAKMLRGKEKQDFYKVVDGAGNIRLDRVSFGYSSDPQNRRKDRIYVRFTGLADRKALADLLKKTMPDSKVEFKKGPKGLITVISAEKHPPAFALIGNTDLLMCGYEGNEENSLEVLEEALEVQAGNKASILKGAYAARLKKVPADAVGALMGDVPEQLRHDMVRGPGSPFKALPKSVVAVVTRTKSIKIDWHGTMADADDAKAFADSVADLKKQGIEQLKQLPPQLKIKPEQVKVMTNALESLRMDAKDDTVSGGLDITQKMIKVAHDLIQKSMEFLMMDERSVPAPAPPKVIEKEAATPPVEEKLEKVEKKDK